MSAPPNLTITVHPAMPHIEVSDSSQSINFDFALENSGSEALHLTKIQLSVMDVSGKLILRKFLDGNGTAPSINTLPTRQVEAGKSQLLFNPFHTLASDIEIAQLYYEFGFEGDPSGAAYECVITVMPAIYETRTPLVVPLHRLFIVYDGHEFYSHHRRFDYTHPVMSQVGMNSNFMRYAYDFCPIDDTGALFNGDDAIDENWIGFNRLIYAPGAGRVVAARDDMLDNGSFDEAEFAIDPIVFFGNHLVIDHFNGEYSLLGHLRQGSLMVKTGDFVEQDQKVAAIGTSGSANIPHLHYELRDGAGIKNVEGLPSYFHTFSRRLGSKSVVEARGRLDSGDIGEG